MPDNGVILVVTDAGTKKKELEDSIKKKSAKKNIKIFIAFSPKCMAAKLCSESMPGYNSVSEGRIFNQTDFDTENFFKSVVYTVRNIYPWKMPYTLKIFSSLTLNFTVTGATPMRERDFARKQDATKR